ncbi:acetoacetyl-CoA synthetase [Trichonephila clavipes]|nr:acetoacetyl-CoA synthetase [Trichonephila clavipes]
MTLNLHDSAESDLRVSLVDNGLVGPYSATVLVTLSSAPDHRPPRLSSHRSIPSPSLTPGGCLDIALYRMFISISEMIFMSSEDKNYKILIPRSFKFMDILQEMNSLRFKKVPLIWTPTEHDGKNAKEFKKIIEQKYHLKLGGYEDLYQWSIENLCEFWTEFWDFLGIISSRRFNKVVDLNIPMNDSPKWFEGAKLNFTENVLKYRDDRLALVVDGHMSNRKEALFATQAVISIGAIWIAALPMLGTKAVLERFQQLES